MLVNKRHSPYKATKLWNQLLNSFKEGMELKRRRWRLKSYEQCFTGAEALDWLHTYLQNSSSFGAHVTREQAFMLLQKFLENDVFQHAAGKTSKKFQDTNCLYTFIEEKENIEANHPKHDKENVSSQNSVSQLIKIFARRNSRTITLEECQQTPLGKVVENNIPPAVKYDDMKKSKAVSSCMTPLALDLNNISMATAVDNRYSDMSTILFDPEEEDNEDVFNTSISQTQFLRSNSLRFNKKVASNTNNVPPFLKSTTKNDNEVVAARKRNKKRAIIRKFAKGSPNHSAVSRRHTVTLGKRQPTGSEKSDMLSPSKKQKKELNRVVKSDSNLETKGYTSSLLPRKAVAVLGEKPSHINHISSYNSYDIVNLPGYKPNKKAQSKQTPMNQPIVDHEEAHINPLVKEKDATQRRKEGKRKPVVKPTLVPLCSSSTVATSPRLTKIRHKTCSSHPMRRRSLSQNNMLRNRKFGSVLDIHKSNFEINKLQKLHHSSNWGLNKSTLYKASSMWSIDTIGVVPNEKETYGPTITTSDMEDTWKSVVILSLKKLLGIERIADFLDESQVCGNSIMKNVNWSTPQLTNDAPEWLLSAMNCLMEWPNSNHNTNDSVLQDLPNYPGFERDVYRAVKEHYHTTLNEPLILCHLYPLLQECAEIIYENMEGAIRLLQHVTLLLPCWNRRQLQLLASFMKGIACNEILEISKDLPNKDLVIHSFFRLITRQEKGALSVGFQDAVAIRISGLLVEYYDEVFKTPSGLRVQVDHKIAVTLGAPSFTRQVEVEDVKYTRPSSADDKPRSMSRQRYYCIQITKEQYEKEAKDLSKKAIRDLLNSILEDNELNEKEKHRRLKQIQKAYPDIYAESACGGDDISNCSTISQRSTNFKHASKPAYLREEIL